MFSIFLRLVFGKQVGYSYTISSKKMIQFERFTLPNGLRVIVHQDLATPMVVMNIMYDVGARDEDENRTGFAHLFEHLMFGGSVNIPSYDEPLQMAGGENNAYTTNDLTNYYLQLPAENLETAFWLESDRMLSLAFDEKSLEVQRKVVVEEFKEHYLSKPYGDVWHRMRELCYKTHPYRWMTIGKDISHIEKAQLADVKNFFSRHYCPINAVMVLAGNITVDKARELAERWFGDIPPGKKYSRNLPHEPEQNEERRSVVNARVPLDAFYKCWHISHRLDRRYYIADLITEILSGGGSSRLYQSLVKEKKLFSNIECHHFGSTDEGLLAIEGKLVRGVNIEDAESSVEEVLQGLKDRLVEESELQKVKNKTESMIAFEDMSVMNRANSLAYYEILGDAAMMNEELEKYAAITTEDILEESRRIFKKENSNTIWYLANK